MSFIVEIQKNIEEKRLVMGQKFERFLLRKASLTADFVVKKLQHFFAQENAVFLSCLLVFLVSIFVRSSRDIGHDSALYIEIAQKILDGKKYYLDFFENNFPLSFFVTIIPVLAAKFFQISPIITLEIFINILGIASIYWSARVLGNQKNIINKILIICFCIGYFWRIYDMQFGEYGTKSIYFLALAFPYIAYQISGKNSPTIQGILAGLLICIKPHYGLLPALFEFSKLNKKNWREIFCLRNFISAFIVGVYLLLMLKFTPEYFQYLSNFSAVYFAPQYFLYFEVLKVDLFPILLFVIVAWPYISRRDPSLKNLYLASIAAAIIIISELIGGYDQRTVFYSLSFPLIAIILFSLISEQKINWKKDGLLILILLAIPQFDGKMFFVIILNFCYFWWLILFFDKKTDRCLIIFAIISLILDFVDRSGEISWLFSALIFLTLFKSKISLFSYNEKNKFISRPAIIVIALVLSYLINLFSAAIFNHQKLYAQRFQSPNKLNEIKVSIINKYAPNPQDDILFIGDSIADFYPVGVYLHKKNPQFFPHLAMLFEVYSTKGIKNYRRDKIVFDENSSLKNATLSHVFKGLKAQMADSNNKIIFLKMRHYFSDECHIGFLEYYLRDEEFAKIFRENYKAAGQIILTEKVKGIARSAFEGEDRDVFEEREMTTDIFEIYVRKN